MSGRGKVFMSATIDTRDMLGIGGRDRTTATGRAHAAKWAEREAKMILAVTEPQGPQGLCLSVARADHDLAYELPIESLQAAPEWMWDGSPQVVLAEALEAFVR